MKNIKFNTKQVLIIIIMLFVLGVFHSSSAQRIKWLHVTELQSPISETGAETEGQFPSLQHGNFFSWPAQYGLEQTIMRQTGFWIGCRNFDDPIEGRLKTVKVIGSGPRSANDRVNQIFPIEIKLIAKRRHPSVSVDNNNATTNDTYDNPDEIDPNLPCDRMVVVKFHTSMGVTVTKKSIGVR